MSEVSSLIEFLKGIFSGLYDLFFDSENTKVILLVVIPIIFTALLVVFCDFILPSLFDLRESKLNTDFNANKLSLYGMQPKTLESLKLKSYLKQFNVKGLRKFRIIRFNARMNSEAVRLQYLEIGRKQFQELYGFRPNNMQLQEFMQYNEVELEKLNQIIVAKSRKPDKDDINDDKDDKKDDKKGNIIELHSDSA